MHMNIIQSYDTELQSSFHQYHTFLQHILVHKVYHSHFCIWNLLYMKFSYKVAKAVFNLYVLLRKKIEVNMTLNVVAKGNSYWALKWAQLFVEHFIETITFSHYKPKQKVLLLFPFFRWKKMSLSNLLRSHY